MLTDAIKERVVRASLEISNAREAVGHILRTLVGYDNRAEVAGGTPVSTSDMPLSRAVDLLEGEISGLQRELSKFREDEPEQAQENRGLGTMVRR